MTSQANAASTALAGLAERFGPMVYRRAYSILRDAEEARDAAQDVFMQILRTEPALQEDASRWLYRVTTNTCLNKLRSRRRHRAMRERNSRGEATFLTAASDIELMVRELLADGEPECTSAALYVYVEGMSHEEAARLLGVSRRTVGNLLERFVCWAQKELENRASADAHASEVEVRRGKVV